jgi:hypothetical protein
MWRRHDDSAFTPRPATSPKIEPVLPPSGRLEVPVPEVGWTPVMIGNAKGESFARALSDKKTLALILPAGYGSPELENRVFQMVKAAVSDTEKDLAARAVAEVLPALDSGWAGELARFGGLFDLWEALREGCAPRHRRIVEAELEQVRGSVAEFLSDLKEAELNAVWEVSSGQERIPGKGPVSVLARVRASADAPTKGV